MSGIVSGVSAFVLFGAAVTVAASGMQQIAEQEAAGAADAAALAAADAALGLSKERAAPCDLAEQVAQRNGFDLGECVLESSERGLQYVVRVTGKRGIFGVAAAARAGTG